MMKKALVVLAAVVAIACLIVALRTGDKEPVAPANAAETATTQTAAPPAPTPLPLPPPPEPTAVAPAVSAFPELTAPPDMEVGADDFAKREQIEAAVAKGDLTKLPELLKTDLTQNGYVAAATIDGVGKLAALAPEKEKREAVGQLGKWLQQETKRKTNDSLGNVSIIVDALQDSKSDAAIAPLLNALDSMQQPLHVETRIVEALTELNAKSAVPSIERWAARVRALQPQDDFQKDLAKEALIAADTAVKKLSS